jgi:hypothetical protein
LLSVISKVAFNVILTITFIIFEVPLLLHPSPDVFPQQIEGVKMTVNKTLSSFFKVNVPLNNLRWFRVLDDSGTSL